MKPRAAEARLEPLITDMLATYMSGWNDAPSLKELSEAGEHVILVVHERATMPNTGAPLE